MTLTNTTPVGAIPADQRDPAADEIIDLTDRRRVLIRALFGLSVDSDTADAVFTVGQPPMSVEDEGALAIADE